MSHFIDSYNKLANLPSDGKWPANITRDDLHILETVEGNDLYSSAANLVAKRDRAKEEKLMVSAEMERVLQSFLNILAVLAEELSKISKDSGQYGRLMKLKAFYEIRYFQSYEQFKVYIPAALMQHSLDAVTSLGFADDSGLCEDNSDTDYNNFTSDSDTEVD